MKGRVLAVGMLVTMTGCSLLLSSNELAGGNGNPPVPSNDAATAGPDATTTPDAESAVDGGSDNDVAVIGNVYAEAVRADGPTGYFRFEDSAGTICKSEIAGSPITCLYPPSKVTFGGKGAVGGCVRFSDATARISVTGPTDFPGNVPFTIELWISIEAQANGELFSQMRDEGSPALRTGTWLLMKASGEAFTETWVNGTHHIYTNNAVVLPVNKAVHIALLHSDKDYLYVDGAVGTGYVLDSSVSRAATGVPMLLGGFVGCVDELAFYDKALSPAQLAAHIAARPQL